MSMRLFVGLMSGTSLDGIDAALVESDGESVRPTDAFWTEPYPAAMRARIRAVLGRADRDHPDLVAVATALTDRHADAVRALLRQEGLAAAEIAAIGFHGQTVHHDPARGLTVQLGDGARLAAALGIDVVDDFRSADMRAGGQGAPFAPAYHMARAAGLERPLAILNLGGVGNVTWLGTRGEAMAFDTGPANALIDDLVAARTGGTCDQDGRLAAAGTARGARFAALLAHPYFSAPPPKTLDRNDFAGLVLDDLSLEDGAATLTALTVETVGLALAHLPEPPRRWLVTGGGRRNPTLMAALCARLRAPVEPVEAVGWNGDAVEAQAFGYLAARHLAGLPLSWPGTTGVALPQTGGRLHRVAA